MVRGCFKFTALCVFWVGALTLCTLLPVSLILQGCAYCTRGPVVSRQLISTGEASFGKYFGGGSPYYTVNDDLAGTNLYGLMRFVYAKDLQPFRANLSAGVFPDTSEWHSLFSCWAKTKWYVRGYDWAGAIYLAEQQFPVGAKHTFLVAPYSKECLDYWVSDTAEADFLNMRFVGVLTFLVGQMVFLALVYVATCVLPSNYCCDCFSWSFGGFGGHRRDKNEPTKRVRDLRWMEDKDSLFRLEEVYMQACSEPVLDIADVLHA